jgi:hypothetical protein
MAGPADLSGFNGSVTLPTIHGGAAAGFSVRRNMNTKETDRYGAGDRFGRERGGIFRLSGDIRVFLRMGAPNTSPGFVTPTPDGSSLTLTLETGCTLSGTALFPDLNVDHAFGDPAIEGTHAYRFTGVVVETWATS